MSNRILLPDDEGHYSASARELDRASHAALEAGRHPVDAVAKSMAVEESRRRFFARGARASARWRWRRCWATNRARR